MGTVKKSMETVWFEAVLEERAPGLRRGLAAAHHVLANAGLAEVDAELEQLTVDPGRTPSGVFAAHPADQVAEFAGNDRLSRCPRRTFQVQNRRKLARCQANTVSGLTMAGAEHYLRQRPTDRHFEVFQRHR